MFTMTNFGVAWFDANPGQAPVFSQFRIGDGYGYTPDLAQTSLQGGLRFTGVPSSPRHLPGGELAYDLFMDMSVGDFNWGEAGLYLNGNLFLVGAYSTPMRKLKLTGDQEGNFVSLSLIVTPGQTAVTVLINNTENELNVQRSGGIDSLPPAQLAYPNIVVVANPTSPYRALLAVAEATVWNIQGYEKSVYQGVIEAASANSIRISSALEDPILTGDFLVQIASGPASGFVRVVSSWDANSRTLTLGNAFPVNPLPGDQVLVSRYSEPVNEVVYPDILDQLDPGLTGADLNQLMDLDAFFAPLVRRDGSTAMEGDLQMDLHQVVGLAVPTQPSHAATKLYVDDGLSLHLAASDPHPQYTNAAEVNALAQTAITGTVPGLISDAVDAHSALGDPHPQYTTASDAQFIAGGAVVDHEAKVDPHPQYTTAAEATSLATASMSAHLGATDPHPQYTTTAEATALVVSGLSTHVGEADPHPQYTSQAEAEALSTAAVATHVASADPHSQYRTEAQVNAAVGASMSAHESAADPHAQYTTDAEVDTRVLSALQAHTTDGNPHSQYQTEAEVEALAQTVASLAASTAVSAHVGSSNPHSQYIQADALNSAILADRLSHEAAADPHPQYTTAAEVTALASPIAAAAASASMDAHLAAADPHPQYVGLAEMTPVITNAVNDAVPAATEAAIEFHKQDPDAHPGYIYESQLENLLEQKEDVISKSLGYAKWTAGGWVFVDETYLQSFTETDPVFTASPAGGITSGEVSNWNAAYSWGDHSAQGYTQGPALVTDQSVAVFDGTTGKLLKEIPGFYWDPVFGVTVRKTPGDINNLQGFAVVAGAEEAFTTYWAGETDFGDGPTKGAGAASSVYTGDSEVSLGSNAGVESGSMNVSYSEFSSGLDQSATLFSGVGGNYVAVSSSLNGTTTASVALRAEDDLQQIDVLGPGVLDIKFPAGVLWKFGPQGQLAVGASNDYGTAGQVLRSNGNAAAVSWTSLGTAALADTSAFVPSTHTTDEDPHPQYTTAEEATALATASVSEHLAATDPHPQYVKGPVSAMAGSLAIFEDVDGKSVKGASNLSWDPSSGLQLVKDPLSVESAFQGFSTSLADNSASIQSSVANLDSGEGAAPVAYTSCSAILGGEDTNFLLFATPTSLEQGASYSNQATNKGGYVRSNASADEYSVSVAAYALSAAAGVFTSGVKLRAVDDLQQIDVLGPGVLDIKFPAGVRWKFGPQGQLAVGASNDYGTVGQVLRSNGNAAAVSWMSLGTAALADTTAFVPSTHTSDVDPHPQYTTAAEAAAVAPVQSVNGMTGNVVLSDYSPSFDVPASLGAGNLAAQGSSSALSRADHQHGVPVGVPVALGSSASAGTSSSLSRADHVHPFPTKTDVGLGNVDNTSDLNKPVSTATQTALNAKQDTLVSGTNIKTVNGSSLLGSGDLALATTWNSLTGTADRVPLSPAAGLAAATGEITWNADAGTADLGLLNGSVLQIGQEELIMVRNNTGNTLTNGMAVMFVGTLGMSGRLLAAPMVADGTYPGYVFLGVVTHDILPGADGYCTNFGKVNNVNTSSFTEQAILWCDPATPGGLTETEPQAPNLKLPIAAVVSSGNNGTLFVRSTTGQRLQDLHDVQANGSTTDGQVLAFNDANSRWQASDLKTINGVPVLGTGDIQVTTGLSGTRFFFENDQLIDEDTTISAGKNAMTAGPISIDDEVTVTISSGSRWVIV